MLSKVVSISPSSSSDPDSLIEAFERRRSAIKVTEFANQLRFSRTVVYGWLDRGELGYFDFEGSRRIDPKEAVRFLRAHYVQASAKLRKAA
jgi:hypothetical protein